MIDAENTVHSDAPNGGASSGTESGKKLYCPPALVRWGSVEDLTENSPGGANDATASASGGGG